MLPVLQLGPLSLPVPPLLLLVAFWLGLELTEKHAPRYQVNPDLLYRMVLAGLLAGIVGARLGYAASAPQAFIASPLSLLALQPQMLDPWSGLLAAALAALIYGQHKHMPLTATLDALTTLFAVIGVGLGLSHFASGDAFGAPTHLPWALHLWGESRHPSQVYETLAALAAAAAVWPGNRISRWSEARPGIRFWAFIGISAAARLFLEAFRGDSSLLFDSVRQAQVIAWIVLALALWQVRKHFQRAP
jgi:phosphatidylglycerol---prolipoprotein diacylglyceryl transferase